MEVYKLQIRSNLEFSCPVWNSAITKTERDDLESVQKTAFHIILGNKYQSYKKALKYLEQDNLETRRESQCFKFAKKISQDLRFKNKFKKALKDTRANNIYHEPKFKTRRYERSAIPYFIRLLNENN